MFQDVFVDDALELSDSMTAEDVDGWDSLAHINLMFAIETEFGFQFSGNELAEMENIGAIKGLYRGEGQLGWLSRTIMENKDHGIRIIGSGCAGMGAAWQLHNEGLQPIVYEAHDYTGGHTYSHVYEDGFVFDEGPHVSFTKNSRFEALLAESVEQDFQAFEAKVNNYWQGHWIKHPAQVNLAGLPIDTVVSCIKDFIHAQHNEYGEINDYQDWLHAAFGPTFRRHIPRPVHQEVPHDRAKEPDDRLAWAAPLSTRHWRSAARRADKRNAGRSLHPALPISDAWWFRVLPEAV